MKTFIPFAILLAALPANAATFWDVMPGARANGMGTAFTSVADDETSVFYNPAGLGIIKNETAGLGVSRRFGDYSTGNELYGAYTVPYREHGSGTWGLGYYGFHRKDIADRDMVTLSFGDEAQHLADMDLEMPVYVGVGLRFNAIDALDKQKAGIGGDIGAITEVMPGLRAGLSIADIPIVGDYQVPRPFFNTGASYRWNNLLFSLDMRIRNSLTEFYPGMEAGFYSGLLKLRAGKGISYDSHSSVAFGLGVDLKKFSVDTAFSVPWSGLSDNYGSFMLSGSYRFGKTAVAAAPRTDDDKCADELNRTTASLRRELDEQDGEIEKLEQQLDKCQNRDCAQAQAEKAAVKNDEKWPKKHRVKNDDTLRSIAAQYYGSGSKWQIVEEANPSKVSKGLPVVGAELTLPDPKGAKRP